jgi:hypothetical protein
LNSICLNLFPKTQTLSLNPPILSGPSLLAAHLREVRRCPSFFFAQQLRSPAQQPAAQPVQAAAVRAATSA